MGALSPLEVYGRGLDAAVAPVLRTADGRGVPLALARWLGPLEDADLAVLERARPPVLDVGCGPGRHTRALARRGVLAVGLDASPAAVHLARRGGAEVLEGDVFARVPAPGTWRTVLLLDGNIGIGGSAPALLARVAELLGPEGEALVELEAPGGAAGPARVRLEGHGERSAWFTWDRVPADALSPLAARAGFAVQEAWTGADRQFARLVRTP